MLISDLRYLLNRIEDREGNIEVDVMIDVFDGMVTGPIRSIQTRSSKEQRTAYLCNFEV